MNYYDVLEVSPKASAEVIRAAYKSLMQRYHPDKSPGSGEFAERAALIAQAYEVLSNEDKRLNYDLELLRRPPRRDAAATATTPVDQAYPTERRAASAPRSVYARYGWVLVVSLIVLGGLIYVLTKKPAATSVAAPGSVAVLAPSPGTAVTAAEPAPAPIPGVGPVVAAVPVAGSQMIPEFVTQLSIGLVPSDPVHGQLHVLQIPNLGVRVGTDDPARWIHKIETDRPLLIPRLLDRLAHAKYEELIKPEGGAYLKRLIEDAMCEALGLERLAPQSAMGSAPPRAQLEVMLSQSYTVK